MAVIAPAGSQAPLTLALHRLLKVPGVWQDREVLWLKHQPGMDENAEPWSLLSASTLSTPGEIANIAQWLAFAKSFATMHPKNLPGFGLDVKNNCCDGKSHLG